MDIKDIALYIIRNKSTSCIAYNSNENEIIKYEDEFLINECKDYFAFEQLGICGCGRPDDTLNVIKEILNTLDRFQYKNEETNDERDKRYDSKWNELYNICGINLKENTNYYGLLQLVLYVLNDKGFLEHGSSVGGSWLTKEGEMLLYVLNNCELELD